jgi:hypothetical protein
MALKKPLVLSGGQIQQLQSGDTLDAVASEAGVITMTNANAGPVVIGTPVYVPVAGSVDKAKADASGTVQVMGLVASTSIAAGSPGTVQCDAALSAITTQWDAVTGQTGGLTAGSVYYLDPATPGKLTVTAPTTAGQYVVRVGLALSTTELDIGINPPILL